MLRNYLAAALRNLVRNKLYAAINIVGLAVGFAAALLIALFVRDEFTFDTWIPGHERTYLLYQTDALPGQAPIESEMTYDQVADWLRLDFPEIEAVGRLAGNGFRLRHGDVENFEPGYWADPNIFQVLPLKAVAGDLSTALTRPDGIVLTRALARKYFGRDDPVGEIIALNRGQPIVGGPVPTMHVTAVIEDMPSNTHLNGSVFVSSVGDWSYPSFAARNFHFSANQVPQQFFYTYMRLKPGASAEALQKALPAFIDRHFPEEIHGVARSIAFRLMPIAAIHMHPTTSTLMKPPGSPATVEALMAVDIVIVLLAAINFVNLMTARAVRRAVEVGVRKTSGAFRTDLIMQFIGESVIHVLIAASVALIAAELLLPAFDAYLSRTIALDHDEIAWAGAAAVVIGILGGAYPALILSSFRPAAVLKGGRLRVGGALLREVLVVLQFAVLIALMLMTEMIHRQTLFALNESLRADRDQVLVVPSGCEDAFKQGVRGLPGVRAAACGGLFVNTDVLASQGAVVPLADGRMLNFARSGADPGWFELLGVKPLAGRLFETGRDEGNGKDANPPIVVNETAMHKLGITSAEDAVGQSISWIRGLGGGRFTNPLPSEIIGVVPDFAVSSMQHEVEPIIYEADSQGGLLVKLAGHDIPETLRAIEALWNRMPRRSGPVQYSFLDQQIEARTRDIARMSEMFAAFTGVAVFIACLGLLGLAAAAAEQRTKEIGVRKALGAGRVDILRLILWEFAKPVLWANVIAWPVGYVVMHRWLEGFAYHVALEPWIFLAASAAALAIALITVSGHALLVARSQPVAALRYE